MHTPSLRLFALLLPAFLALSAVTHAGDIDPKTVKVSASDYEQKAKGGWGDMPPERSLDGDLKTAWMCEGDGVWIQYDLGSAVTLKAVKLGFSSGDKRVYTFDIQLSGTGADGSWKTVGDKLKSSGKTNDQETFEFTATPARFVRIVGHGNTNEKFAKWCNITEAGFVTQ